MCIASANAADLPVPKPAATPPTLPPTPPSAEVPPAADAPQEFPPSDPPPKFGEYKWKRAYDATGASIAVHKVPEGELRRLQSSYGTQDNRNVASHERKGFTVLKGNPKTGKWHADIYMIDPTDEETLKHELLHARGWTH